MHPPRLRSPSQAALGYMCTTGTGWALLQRMWNPEQKHSGDPPPQCVRFALILQAVPPQQPLMVLKIRRPLKVSVLYSSVKRSYSLDLPVLFILHIALRCTQCSMKSFSLNVSDRSLPPMLCPTAPVFPCGCSNISLYLIKQLHPWTSFFF